MHKCTESHGKVKKLKGVGKYRLIARVKRLNMTLNYFSCC